MFAGWSSLSARTLALDQVAAAGCLAERQAITANPSKVIALTAPNRRNDNELGRDMRDQGVAIRRHSGARNQQTLSGSWQQELATNPDRLCELRRRRFALWQL